MNIRKFDRKKDYILVLRWWKDWGWPALPLEALPQNGYIVENMGKPICAAWLYKTDSCLASIEWIISDAKASREEREGTIELLFNKLFDIAKEEGFTMVFSSVKNLVLKNKMLDLGYQEGDINMTNMIKVLV